MQGATHRGARGRGPHRLDLLAEGMQAAQQVVANALPERRRGQPARTAWPKFQSAIVGAMQPFVGRHAEAFACYVACFSQCALSVAAWDKAMCEAEARWAAQQAGTGAADALSSEAKQNRVPPHILSCAPGGGPRSPPRTKAKAQGGGRSCASVRHGAQMHVPRACVAPHSPHAAPRSQQVSLARSDHERTEPQTWTASRAGACGQQAEAPRAGAAPSHAESWATSQRAGSDAETVDASSGSVTADAHS